MVVKLNPGGVDSGGEIRWKISIQKITENNITMLLTMLRRVEGREKSHKF
jgi:hypothetical protein